MKPKLYACLIALFCSRELSAGCGGVHCTCSNGLSTYSYNNHGFSSKNEVNINSIDSLEFFFYRVGGCGSLAPYEVFVDNVKIKFVTPHFGRIKLLGIPGKYKITTMYGEVSFLLTMNVVGLGTLSRFESKFTLYPNPAKGEINLLSANTELKVISLYNSIGQKLAQFELTTESLKIPLHNYPAGIYFIHVATLNDKTAIRKIVVL